jgi:hypothetical protein
MEIISKYLENEFSSIIDPDDGGRESLQVLAY